jgi:hypothetical protein
MTVRLSVLRSLSRGIMADYSLKTILVTRTQQIPCQSLAMKGYSKTLVAQYISGLSVLSNFECSAADVKDGTLAFTCGPSAKLRHWGSNEL